VFATTGAINTSDAREKVVIGDIEGAATNMVKAVKPKLYRWKSGTRTHAGFLAQDIKAAMTDAGVDFAAWGLDDATNPDSRQWLRPDQLIPVLWQALRDAIGRIDDLEARVEALA
jgi:hypothetical protein